MLRVARRCWGWESNGNIYVSTAVDKQNRGGGIIALRLGADHKTVQVEHFGVDGGTRIRFYKDALYAASAIGLYRYTFRDRCGMLPGSNPAVIVDLIILSNAVSLGGLISGLPRLSGHSQQIAWTKTVEKSQSIYNNETTTNKERVQRHSSPSRAEHSASILKKTDNHRNRSENALIGMTKSSRRTWRERLRLHFVVK